MKLIRKSWEILFNEYNILYPDNSIETILNKCYNINNRLTVFPKYENCFRCFNYFELNETRIVILGQDPYHNLDQACGLAFGVDNQKNLPPSLANIKRELKTSLSIELDDHTLEKWVKQGVLLLNTALTVEKNKPGSHIKLWNNFIIFIINKLNMSTNGIVFLCWGAHAHKLLKNIDNPLHNVIITSHPSPLSCNRKYKEFPAFNGSNCFIHVNDIINKKGECLINW